MKNEYIPFRSEIKKVTRHTDLEYTFRMAFDGVVKPGQFFEVSIPKFGEAPISVSGIGEDSVDLTIRRVGKVTDEVFEHYAGQSLFLRGPYGNGFDTAEYRDQELVIIAGGTGLSPVKGIVDYYSDNITEAKSVALIAGFKTPNDILFREDFEQWEKSINVTLTVDSADADAGYPVGLVTEYIPKLKMKDVGQAKAIVVGPPMMMKFVVISLLKAGFQEDNIWVSYERKMCCGIGKCGHCKMDDRYICLDGPVFNYKDAKTLID